MLGPDKNPSIENAEITINAAKTISPIKALLPLAKYPEALKAKTKISSRTKKHKRLLIERNSVIDAVSKRYKINRARPDRIRIRFSAHKLLARLRSSSRSNSDLDRSAWRRLSKILAV